ncbi:hypothetical protein PB2503_11234 [Parvularcula bermudensis HTCC2503]|uniref:Endolytic murein transglycosylase n=1 Tax=Parvularcula bermudensis (strain ATCC BAA-594 / HTCC2503 / KCTC 12087) TaxID=314260 RepID=E0TC36_PARBH|nr:hypothetical protein PB2503_11234 [Parvularcula bermudensis HTCC2503]
MVGAIRVVLILAIVASVAALGVAIEFERRVTRPGPLEADQVLWIKRGDGVDNVTRSLTSLGALERPVLLKVAARLEKLTPALRAGEFVIPAGSSIRDIIAILKDGDPLLRFVTVPEGMTSRQAAAIIDAAPMLTGTVDPLPAEGSLLPETYSYQRGDDRNAVVARMQAAHDRLLSSLWPDRDPQLPLDTPEEAVILASIVEKETGVAAERPRVAAVFVNRLNRGMRLQSDPTIIYGLTQGEPLGRGLYRSEVQRETPYNTYVIDGLPPTPIANPGEASLRAVLNPLSTDDLYFVADGTGGHVFAKTLAEHSRNVREWRKIEAARRKAGQ